MQVFVDAVNRVGAEWATLVVAVLWQSTLVALVVGAVAYALKQSSPALRYWLWQVVAIKLLVVPFWSFSFAAPWLVSAAPGAEGAKDNIVARVARREVTPAAELPATVPLLRRALPAHAASIANVTWRGWLIAGWAAVVLLQILRLAVQRVRLARLLRQCEPGDARLAAVVSEIAGRLQLEHPPRTVTTTFECSPFVCGILRSTLVLPRGLAATLGRGELAQIVAHELAHIKRRDLVWGWIPEVARMVYFFHPVAHWAAGRIRLERELACDQVAMHHSGRTPAEYAETLVHVLGAASGASVFRTSATAPLDG